MSGPLQPRQARGLAQGLGWFSIGLGLVEVLAPHRVTRATGLEGHERLVASYGLREIATGIGLLTTRDPQPWLWGRVSGDVLDVGTLAAGLRPGNPERDRSGMALLAVLGVTALDLACALALRPSRKPPLPLSAYRRRSGLPRPPGAMRGAASDFVVPADFRTPDALRWPAPAGSR
ncbi:cyclase dehydrase [Belnapia sp. T6]|uniref:Cyclase dehydrase n=1 Tax=Belnapia mucosa TaxID=2804532 RepID=A0ABS1V9A3_9PROT|nr:cyclase dehydrase [Belnapia mucosa]MBL6458261.1 cyclase dehydrase [Belnapia mucosa]